MILQYASILVYDILENQSTNVTLDEIDKSFTLLGGSLLGDRENNNKSEGENYCIAQEIFDIDMVDIYFKVVIEVSSVSLTLIFSQIITRNNIIFSLFQMGSRGWQGVDEVGVQILVLIIGIIFIVNSVRVASVIMGRG